MWAYGTPVDEGMPWYAYVGGCAATAAAAAAAADAAATEDAPLAWVTPAGGAAA